MAESRELTKQEKDFLDFLFDGEAVRHPNEAKQMAGYPKDYPLQDILKNINSELIKRCDNYLTLYSAQGILALIDLINNPNIPGAKVKLSAVQDLLDRGGVVKKEKSEVVQQNQQFLVLLPAKTEIIKE